ncbi:MAG: RpoL/Rpb11 RNA polymerase subunit family protein [Candidatus Hydrothermarchaeaceae archaeon]
MELKVINESRNELEFELIGEDHTFSNSLREVLNKNKSVLSAAYRVEHLLLTPPRMMIMTKEVSRLKIPQRMVPLSEVKGVAEKREKQLRKAGIKTANALAKADANKVYKKSGIPLAIMRDLINEASKINFLKGSIARVILKKSLKELARSFSAVKLKGAR